jgi:hypothetical protein
VASAQIYLIFKNAEILKKKISQRNCFFVFFWGVNENEEYFISKWNL